MGYTRHSEMLIETPTETPDTVCHPTMASSDSDEEQSPVDQPVTPWDELSIVERVGLNIVQMSEAEIESAYCQITLAFRTDQYTLKQRLQAEEHARDLAEENVQQELSRGRETLETLKGLCLDIRRRSILQRLELSLDILGGTVGRISNTAELLGSVHQEARICRAVEIMAAHVENMKRRHEREGQELERTKKLVHRISRRNLSEPGTPTDVDEMELQKQDKKSFQNYNGRRRVSVSIITKESQENRRELKKQTSLCDGRDPSPSSEPGWSLLTRAVSSEGRLPVDAEHPQEAAAVVVAPVAEPSPVSNPESPPPPPPSHEEAARKTRGKSAPLDCLRQRHRGKAALSKRKDRDRKGSSHLRSSFSSSFSLRSPALWPFPSAPWPFRSRWAIFYLALLLMVCAATLTLLS